MAEKELEIDNVIFKEGGVYLRGALVTNLKAGYKHCRIVFHKAGILIHMPAQGDFEDFETIIPYSHVRQADIKTS